MWWREIRRDEVDMDVTPNEAQHNLVITVSAEWSQNLNPNIFVLISNVFAYRKMSETDFSGVCLLSVFCGP